MLFFPFKKIGFLIESFKVFMENLGWKHILYVLTHLNYIYMCSIRFIYTGIFTDQKRWIMITSFINILYFIEREKKSSFTTCNCSLHTLVKSFMYPHPTPQDWPCWNHMLFSTSSKLLLRVRVENSTSKAPPIGGVFSNLDRWKSPKRYQHSSNSIQNRQRQKRQKQILNHRLHKCIFKDK